MHKLFFHLLTMLFCTTAIAQQSINSGGGTATGSGGVVTFTTGQSAFTVADGTGGSSSAGVQQAYVITPTGTLNTALDIAVKVFPNPTAHLLQIETENHKELRWQLLDVSGKQVQSGKIKNGKATLDMASYAPGNYRLTIWQKSNRLQTFSILKNSL